MYCKVTCVAALVQHSHEGGIGDTDMIPVRTTSPCVSSSTPVRVKSRLLPLAVFIFLSSHSLRPPRHLSCQSPHSEVQPRMASPTSGAISKPQGSPTWSHPRRDRTSIPRVCLSHSPACSFSFCSTHSVLYYTTLAFTLLD